MLNPLSLMESFKSLGKFVMMERNIRNTTWSVKSLTHRRRSPLCKDGRKSFGAGRNLLLSLDLVRVVRLSSLRFRIPVRFRAVAGLEL
ncbi:hypothetical protein LINPERHAP1_LOCUS15296 [Linum perenne]